MKNVVLFILLCMIPASAQSEDLKLTNGRTLTKYKILSQSPTTVTVRYSGGGIKINKNLLPDDILKLYPIDEEAAKAEAAQIEKDRAIYEAHKKAVDDKRLSIKLSTIKKENALETEREKGRLQAELKEARSAGAQEVADEKANRDKQKQLIADHNSRQMGVVSDALSAKIKSVVKLRAERFFKNRPGTSSSSLSFGLKFDLQEPRAIPGWENRFEVIGVVWWQSYNSQGSSFRSNQEWFRADVSIQNGRPNVTQIEAISEPRM